MDTASSASTASRPTTIQTLKRSRHQELARSSNFVAREAMLEDARHLDRPRRRGQGRHRDPSRGAGRRTLQRRESARLYRVRISSARSICSKLCVAHPCRHLLIASTSSVYGANRQQPFEEAHDTDHPVSLYAATKKATEAIAYSYAHLNGLPTTVMRLFTVYGPWGRPDMALFKFTRNIIAGEPIEVYGAGKMTRDFTYVDDVVEAIAARRQAAAIERPPIESSMSAAAIPSVSRISSRSSRRRSAARRCAAICRCSPATYRRPGRARPCWNSSPASARRPRCPMACAPSWPGIASIIESDRRADSLHRQPAPARPT